MNAKVLSAVVMLSLLAVAAAQRSPYAGSSDPGVLPQYLPQGTDNRFGEDDSNKQPNKQMHAGTLENEDLYNRVAEWPDQHKPFWYLNAAAIQAQREQQQQQQATTAASQQQAVRNRQSPFTRRTQNQS